MNAKHQSRSLERHVNAPREHTWTALNDLIEKLTGGYVVEGDPAPHGPGAVLHLNLPGRQELLGSDEQLVETVLSFEPPWRRSYSVTGPTGLDLYHATFVLRDDNDECHLSWGVVVDPEPSPAGAAFLDFAVATIDSFLDHVVTVAEKREDLGG